jgi:hypothetical protein
MKNFRTARAELKEIRDDMFPIPCVVNVRRSSIDLIGIVWKDCMDDYPMELMVFLENGNTWTYPLESCTRNDNREKWPTWIKEDFEERARMDASH